MYWQIEPYHSDSADCCVLPANTEEEHRAALEYAKERLEEVWDEMEPGESRDITLKLRNGEMPEVIE